MGIGKQIVICTLMGVLFSAGQVSGNQHIAGFTKQTQQVLCRDYTVSDVKAGCIQAVSGMQKLTDQVKNAAQYAEETMARL